MRGDYLLPTGDWSSRDSLTELTEVYERPEAPRGSAPMELPLPPEVRALATQPSPVVVAPIAYIPMQRYEIPTIAPLATGSSPQVRISERLDKTHRVERPSSWQRIPLIAGIVGAIVLGIGVGVVVSMHGSQIEAAPVAVAKPVVHGPTVTPIEVPPPARKAVVAAAPQVVEPAAPVLHHAPVHHEARAPREARHEHVTPAAVTATGMLRISSKPPCAIAIDGKPSGKTTPQAALALPIGSHQVTLTNEEQGIQLTTEVAIEAGKRTSVVQDFTK
ncbi:MAG: PEGA domain-containing protein [Deltaproteobacteria bacterium]